MRASVRLISSLRERGPPALRPDSNSTSLTAQRGSEGRACRLPPFSVGKYAGVPRGGGVYPTRSHLDVDHIIF